QDEIPDRGRDVLHDLALKAVVQRDDLALRHAQTHRRRTLPRPLAQAVRATEPGVARSLLARVRRARDARHLGARAVAQIDEVATREVRERRLVALVALRLHVRTVRPADVRTLVP